MATSIGEPLQNREPVLIWEARLFARLGNSPWRVGLGVTGGLLALHFAVRAALGLPEPPAVESDPLLPDATRTILLLIALLAYALSVPRLAFDIDQRDLKRVGFLPEGETGSVMGEVDPQVARRGRWAGVIGAAFGLSVGVLVSQQRPEAELHHMLLASFWLSEWFLVWPLTAVLACVLGRGLYFQGWTARATQALVRDQVPVDLLNRRPLFAAGRIALRTALVWIGGCSLGLLLFAGEAHFESFALLLLVIGLVAVVMAIVPVLGVRAKIRAAKLEALEETEAELRLLRDREQRGTNVRDGRIADLLSYHAYVERISDWPYDAPTLARFLLYLLIPAGSWLGGAMVERLVTSMLD